jgi:DNA-binding LytR/AlgR family response regulator
MKKIKVIIVDDEPLSREGLTRYIEQIEFLELVETFENPLKVIPFLATSKVDLILLDIQMPYLNGFDFLKNLKNPPMVIFHTAYPSYALESYQLDVIDYLVKPVLFDRFQKAITKAYDYYCLKIGSTEIIAKKIDYIFVKSEGRLEKIHFDEILYLEAMQNYTIIYHKNTKTIVLQLIKYFEELLPKDAFLRIHKSHIVRIAKIEAIEGNLVLIENKKIAFAKQIKEELFHKIGISKL